MTWNEQPLRSSMPKELANLCQRQAARSLSRALVTTSAASAFTKTAPPQSVSTRAPLPMAQTFGLAQASENPIAVYLHTS